MGSERDFGSLNFDDLKKTWQKKEEKKSRKAKKHAFILT